tara:strand:+ start:1017 stop:1622 length:606 start_codon:yes stop_codon:yes gene_type:complete
MARRIVLGERANGDYGLFVSATGEDANSSDNLTFDSNAVFTSGIFAYGQGSVSARTSVSQSSPKTLYTAEGTSGGQNDRIAHSLGYSPQVFLRWCYADELFTNPSGYPSGTYGVTALSPGRVSSTTSSIRFIMSGGEPLEVEEMNNAIGYGIDFEVDSTYLYISNYEAGFKGFPLQETKFTGLTIYYAYIITTAPDNGLKL